MKKFVSLLLVLTMVLTVSFCVAEEDTLSTGLALITGISGKDAAADKDGLAQADVSFAAVTVDAAGVVTACVIDTVQCKMYFNAAGVLTTDKTVGFTSKLDLGDAYGMRVASSIGAEWNEQAAAFADWCIGKTVDEIKGIAVNENGKASDVDLAATVTLAVAPFVELVEKAVTNAKPCGAKAGDTLYMTYEANCSGSRDASAEKNGNAQAEVTVAAITVNGGVVTSACLDAVQAKCAFTVEGKFAADPAAEILTKQELQDGYGMRVASAIGKEWFEQAAGFCEFVTGKTIAEVLAIPMDESGKTTDADLATSCTIASAEYVSLFAGIAE